MENNQNKITACLVIYNEEAIIERCLKSLQGVVDKILVIHDGKCTDKTLAICRKYKCEIHIRKHFGLCEPHRAWSYTQVKTPWILQIDADEFLSPGLKSKIRFLVTDKQVNCYEFLWRYWDGKQYLTKNWPWKRILFRKKEIEYLALPHEEIRVKGMIKRVSLNLEHRPNYDNFSLATFKTKHVRWIKNYAKLLLMPISKMSRYPARAKHLTPHYYQITKQPLLLALPLTCYHFLGTYLNGGYKEGFAGFKMCLVMSIYYAYLCYQIWLQKLNLK